MTWLHKVAEDIFIVEEICVHELAGDVPVDLVVIFLALRSSDSVLQHSCCVGLATVHDCCSIYEVQMNGSLLCLQQGRLEIINDNCLVMREMSLCK